MLIHIWVLLVALDRTQPGKLANEFLSRWRRGDLQGTLLFYRSKGCLQKNVPLGQVQKSMPVLRSSLFIVALRKCLS